MLRAVFVLAVFVLLYMKYKDRQKHIKKNNIFLYFQCKAVF